VIDDALVLRVERLRDEVEDLRLSLRERYGAKTRQVTAQKIRDAAAQLGERWLVEVAARDDVRAALGHQVVADLNIEFQRLLTYSDQATIRGKYESSVGAILRDFRARVIVPLKQARDRPVTTASYPDAPARTTSRVAFVGHSFHASDALINDSIAQLLEALGFQVITGEKPKGDSVSKKVRERIERADYFVGIFTRRDRVRARQEWTTSAWVIDEKAYALANRKKLVLVREKGVQSIGGIQGDYEYLEFTRDELVELVIKLVAVVRSLEEPVA
jgi:hypothetical protein